MTYPPHMPKMSDGERDAMRRDDHGTVNELVRLAHVTIAGNTAFQTGIERRLLASDERIARTEGEVAALRAKVDEVAASSARIEQGVSTLGEQMRSMDATLAGRISREEIRPRAWLFLDHGGVRAVIGGVILAIVSAAVMFDAPSTLTHWLRGLAQ